MGIRGHRTWLYQTQAWWRVCLRPGNIAVPLVFAVLWLTALLCYWYPRRLQQQVVGIAAVAAMVLIGGVLTTASLMPCHGGQTPSAVAGWVLDLYVGNPPSFPIGACTMPPSLAYQLGGPVSLAATLTGALTVAVVLWRQPVDKLRARWVRDATIVTGLDHMTIPLLERLAQTYRPGSIVVIEPDASHPLLAAGPRDRGPRHDRAPPSSPRVLLPVIAGSRGCALRRLYAVRGRRGGQRGCPGRRQDHPAPATSPIPTASLTWSPGSTIPGTPITRRGWHMVGPAAGSRTPSAPAPQFTAAGAARPRLPHRAPAVAALRGQHPGPGHPPRTGPAGLGTTGTHRRGQQFKRQRGSLTAPAVTVIPAPLYPPPPPPRPRAPL